MIPLIQDIEVNNKVVLTRLDLNVPFRNGHVVDDSRIKTVQKTLNYLVKNDAKILIISHLGRPKGTINQNLSLSKVLSSLKNVTKLDFKFSKSIYGIDVENQIKKLKRGEILLLENLRFFKEEEENDPNFSEKLAKMCDIFCNDAFSVSHRSHSSTVGVTNFLPSFAGFSLQREITKLDFFLKNPIKPVVALVGGAKVSTKLELLISLIKQIDYLIIGGGMANTFLNALNKNVGKSLCEFEMSNVALKVINEARINSCKILLPEDIVCSHSFKENASSNVYDVENCPKDEMILDAGPKTIKRIKKIFDKCNTLIWNGPLGAFEISPFDKATIEVSKYAAELTNLKKIKTIAGGGDTISALNKACVTEKFSYVSTSGGAFLEWLEGNNLPGILALKNSVK